MTNHVLDKQWTMISIYATKIIAEFTDFGFLLGY